jgi:caffeoyl-CoA O-methyltransferase
MTPPKSVGLAPDVYDYLLAHSTPVDEVQRSLIAETQALGGIALMQVSPEQGALLTLLVQLSGARRVVEVGTFTGYSALCLARGLPPGGTLLCCDVNEEWTAIGRRHWERAGVADRIELRIAPAADTLRSLPAEPAIDLAFIDADKPGYATYFDELVPRLRRGGLLLVDNVLWSGRVVDPTDDEEETRAIRAFNDKVVTDERVDVVMLPVADGLSLVRRR